MTERAEAEFASMQRRVRTAALLLLLLFASGVLGYKLVGGAEHTWLDAIYMATITLTTTGMRDVIPTNTPLPIVMPALAVPFASSRHWSSIITLSPMRILCGCRNTTFWPKITFRPQAPSSVGYSHLRSARPSSTATPASWTT